MTDRAERQMDIYLFLQANTGVHFTLAEVAHGVSRIPNGSFRVDVSAARHLAQENGEQITNCHMERRPNGDLVQVLHHHTKHNEKGETLKPLAVQGGQAATRVRNQGLQAEFTAKHGASKLDRREAGLYVKVSKVTDGLFDLIGEVESTRAELERLARQAAFQAAARKRKP